VLGLQTYRPYLHFAPLKQWLNDPNGLVYYAGEYHLFFQHYPHDDVWGPMHWGHAVSTDLIHWEELPIALYPEGDTIICSGSAVIDHNNTTGFGYNAAGEPPMIAIYTSHTNRDGQSHLQTQSIAFSHDRGRTFTSYNGNPVLEWDEAADFRDPKVFWYEPGSYWVMSVVCKNHVRFYKSDNLRHWHYLSSFGDGEGASEGDWECPDLVKLDDRWVLIISVTTGAPNGGSGTQYFVGDFDGTTFTNANASDTVLWLDYGCDNYAGVTWNDEPNGRTILIGWMNNWAYAAKTPSVGFRGTMTLPRELSLKEGRLVQKPIAELKKFKRRITRGHYAFSIPSEGAYQVRVKGKERGPWSIRLQHGDGEETLLSLDPQAGTLTFDRSQSGIGDFHPDFAKLIVAPYVPSEKGTVRVRLIIDASSIEVFVNGGRTVMTNQLFPATYSHVFVRDGIDVEKMTLSKFDI
jgi:fructan beta-fructosidase